MDNAHNPYPDQLHQTERAYFRDQLDHIRDWIIPPQEIREENLRRPRIIPGVRLALPDLRGAVIETEKARAMATAFSNFLKYSTPSHRGFYLRRKYPGLKKAYAKQAVKRVGISIEERLEMAKEAHQKCWEAKPFLMQRDLWTAKRVQRRDYAIIAELSPLLALPFLTSEIKLDEKKH